MDIKEFVRLCSMIVFVVAFIASFAKKNNTDLTSLLLVVIAWLMLIYSEL